MFLGSLLVCLLKYDGKTPEKRNLVVFKPLSQIKFQLDGEGELNVACSKRFRNFMNIIFGISMTKSIINYHQGLVDRRKFDAELISERIMLRKQLDADLSEYVSGAKTVKQVSNTSSSLQ